MFATIPLGGFPVVALRIPTTPENIPAITQMGERVARAAWNPAVRVAPVGEPACRDPGAETEVA